ncbi:DNA-binding protein, partial [Candidatus Parcubacteria bacterium]|nr:DNA-binding protein [Candidatus Parcubacteria bacterium]
MKAKKVGKNIFLIKLERGEEHVESLKDFFKKQKIKGGWF